MSKPLTYARAPEPVTDLGRYRVLSPACGLRVSPITLGTMSLGDKWPDILGKCTKEQAFEVYDTYYAAGGNFIDTAGNYQDGVTEEWLGEWMETRGVRDEMVVATKYTTMWNPDAKQRIQYSGNGAKSLRLSIEASLKKLRTDYVDILYLHWYDYSAPIEEIMQSLNHLVKAGKVLHLGISDTPAWIVSAANQYARHHGLAPFVIYQCKYSLLTRDAERDLIPMMRHFGMAFAPFGAMGAGRLQTPEAIEQRKQGKEKLRQGNELFETEVAASQLLSEIGHELGGKSLQSVALAYAIAKYEYCYPMIGLRHARHVKSNIEALSIRFTEEQIERLDKVGGDFSLGTPMQQFGTSPTVFQGQESYMAAPAGQINHVQGPRSFAAPKA